MREYLSILISVALLGGVIGMLSPEGELKKYLRLLCSLCLLCAMVVPFFSALREGELSLDGLFESEESESVDYDEIYNQSLLNGNRENAENIIQSRIAQAFDLSYDSFEVRAMLSLKNNKYVLEEIALILHPEAIFADPKKLTEFVNESYDCPCVVIYE